MSDLPDVRYGRRRPADWREIEPPVDPDDDQVQTPDDVVEMLGFDPATEDDDGEEDDDDDEEAKPLFGDAKWDESKHPRGQPGNPGQFGLGGGGGKGEPDFKGKLSKLETDRVFAEPGSKEHTRLVNQIVQIAIEQAGVKNVKVVLSQETPKANIADSVLAKVNVETGVLTLFMKSLPPFSAISGILAHELQHIKNKRAEDHVHSIVDTTPAKIWASQAKGLSSYADGWWEYYSAHRLDKDALGIFHAAVDETLAELARVRWLGEVPDGWLEKAPKWNELLSSINKKAGS